MKIERIVRRGSKSTRVVLENGTTARIALVGEEIKVGLEIESFESSIDKSAIFQGDTAIRSSVRCKRPGEVIALVNHRFD